MATIQKRKSHGKNYWYIVESRRINGKPRPVTLAYLGRAEDLLERLNNKKSFEVKSYAHGDVYALMQVAKELDLVNIINKNVVASNTLKSPPVRDGISVGESMLLAAINRICHPSSKRGWLDWCKETSLELIANKKFSKIDSQHFWDQMSFIKEDSIDLIEKNIVSNIIKKSQTKLDCLFFDTTNFFTFIDSVNEHCTIPQRGHNKQKRYDLRQIGMALLATREDQIPLFHKTYSGNQNDSKTFKEVFSDITTRIKEVSEHISDITLVFDKGNNSKENFAKMDEVDGLHYVAGLVPSYFKDLLEDANKNFGIMVIDGEDIPVYRVKTKIWGAQRTCVITVSKQLKEGQLQGIEQYLATKYKLLESFKKVLESPKCQKRFTEQEIKERTSRVIKGQFIEHILKIDLIKLNDGRISFTYSIDQDAFDHLQNSILGRKIHVTNRHDWSNEEICLAYRSQSKVERCFRDLKNPFHCSVRPQYHWTDQKIKVHILICILGYLLATYLYTKIKKNINYQYSLQKMLEDLHTIRLTTFIEEKNGSKGLPKVEIRLEKIRDKNIAKIASVLNITDKNYKINIAV